MRKRIDWNWEKLDENTRRAKVIGGWLIEVCVWNKAGGAINVSVSFVPDRDHEWEIMPPIVDTVVERTNLAKDFMPAKAES